MYMSSKEKNPVLPWIFMFPIGWAFDFLKALVTLVQEFVKQKPIQSHLCFLVSWCF